MLARLDPRFLDRLWFPLGDQTKEETRAEAERAGLAAARRAESQEACFLAGDDYRTFLGRHGLRRRARPDRRRGRTRARRRTTASGASRPGSGAGSASRRPSRSTRCAPTPTTNTVVVGPREALATRTVERARSPLRRRPRASRRSFATARAASRRRSSRATAASCSSSTSPPTASRRARPRCSTRTVSSSAPGLVIVRLARCSPTAPETSSMSPLRSSCSSSGSGSRGSRSRLGGTLQRLSALIKGTQDEVLPVITKVGTTVDHVNAQMEKLDRITDSAVDAADSADTAVRAVSLAVTRPVQKLAGFAAGVTHGFADLKVHRNWRSAVDAAKAAAAAREQELDEELRDAGKRMTDVVTLQLPRERDFHGVAHLVLGGLARATRPHVRRARGHDDGDRRAARAARVDGRRHAVASRSRTTRSSRTVGPFSGSVARRAARVGRRRSGSRRVLETVVDEVDVSERDGEQWVELTKTAWRSRADGRQRSRAPPRATTSRATSPRASS